MQNNYTGFPLNPSNNYAALMAWGCPVSKRLLHCWVDIIRTHTSCISDWSRAKHCSFNWVNKVLFSPLQISSVLNSALKHRFKWSVVVLGYCMCFLQFKLIPRKGNVKRWTRQFLASCIFCSPLPLLLYLNTLSSPLFEHLVRIHHFCLAPEEEFYNMAEGWP